MFTSLELTNIGRVRARAAERDLPRPNIIRVAVDAIGFDNGAVLVPMTPAERAALLRCGRLK